MKMQKTRNENKKNTSTLFVKTFLTIAKIKSEGLLRLDHKMNQKML